MQTQPISLTDSQLAAVMVAASVIAPARRSAFLQALAEELRGQAAVGDGSLHRAIALLQPRFHDPLSVSTRHELRHNKLRVGPPIA
jgi:hypothetical protein